jgi:hypothetical protein
MVGFISRWFGGLPLGEQDCHDALTFCKCDARTKTRMEWIIAGSQPDLLLVFGRADCLDLSDYS